jgi:tRNA threonylcarbamoyladenosine biosynthesis protein TsaE
VARITCPTPEDTLALGDALGRAARPGLTVLLQGPLGAGKTLLTKGIARGLGVPGWRYVTSPTFAIHNQYRGRLTLHHLDLYRLGDAGELETVGVEEFLYGCDICVVEWPDSFFAELPSDRLWVCICGDAEGNRVVRIRGDGDTAAAVLAEVAAQFGIEGGD